MKKEDVSFILSMGDKLLLDLLPKGYKKNFKGVEWALPEWAHVLRCLNEKVNRTYARSERLGLDNNLSLEFLAELWLRQQGRCAISRMIMSFESGTSRDKNPWGCSIDRIDSNKGYYKDNIRLVTHCVNNARNVWPDSVLETMVRNTAKYLQ